MQITQTQNMQITIALNDVEIVRPSVSVPSFKSNSSRQKQQHQHHHKGESISQNNQHFGLSSVTPSVSEGEDEDEEDDGRSADHVSQNHEEKVEGIELVMM